MKNLKLALKLALGFGLVLVIALILGGFAMWRMSDATHSANGLVNEKIPEVTVANNVQKATMLTMYEIRGYGLTGEDSFHTAGLKHLESVKEHLKAAKDLGTKYAGLEQLKTAAEKAEVKALEYEQLVNDTRANDKAMDGNRSQMDANAQAFVKICYSYLETQNKAFDADTENNIAMDKLRQRNLKINLLGEATRSSSRMPRNISTPSAPSWRRCAPSPRRRSICSRWLSARKPPMTTKPP
ncbi:MAG: hypothetical protein NT173_05370 [Opitutales bacterium]|nr:hypothetical protein [Opitutales bacterium]